MKRLLQKLKKKNARKIVIGLSVLLVMLFSIIPLVFLAQKTEDDSSMVVHAAPANSRKATLTYYDVSEFVAYSNEYASNAELYSEDIITLSLTSNVLPESFRSLGTEEWPFNGKIYINTPYGQNWYFDLDKPLFSYVTDSVSINYSVSEHNTEPVQLELRRKHVDSTQASVLAPLFAEHVVKGTGTPATWKIKTSPYEDAIGNIFTYNFSGVIGDLGEDASLTIDFVNDSYHVGQSLHSNIASASDIGLICGKMFENSKIELTLSGTNVKYNVESTETGNAGGLVGTMLSGSVLEIKSLSGTPDSSRSITATSGYAGGLVGYSEGGIIQFPTPSEGESPIYATVNGTITGTTGAGGLYGYYSNPEVVSGGTATPQDVTFDLSNYNVNCTVQAASAGGLFGVLNSTADITIDGTSSDANEISVTGSSVTNFGGITGSYSTSALANKLEIDTVTANTDATFSGTSYYGGVCGQITGNQAAYVKVSDLTHKSSAGFADANAFGGVIGDAGTAGSMLDVGSVTIETGVTGETANGSAYKGGGIVGVLTDGVLRLSGTTDLTKAPSSNVDKDNRMNGQLVGYRKNSLVYAIGSGNTGDSGWVFKRSKINVEADDIGTWGSVLRPHTTNLPIADLETKDGAETPGVLDFHTTNHTVTVAAPVTSIATASDFTKTALNIQLNTGDKGALKFSDSVNKSNVLLGTNLSFATSTNTTPIELSGTGNIGLMRDDYIDDISEIGMYTKTISGGKVNLAIGERYGVYTGSSTIGKGDIVAHRYNGLIARTGANAGASGLTVGGTINVDGKLADTYVGGVFARVTNGISLASVDAKETININALGGSPLIVGGMAGYITAGTVSLSGGTVQPTLRIAGSIGNSKDDGIVHSFGGAIGRIDSASAQNVTVSTLTVKPTITSSGITSIENISAAGFIADIIGDGIKTMSLTGVTVSGASLTNTATSHAGGFLGMRWRNINVSFTANNGVIVSGTNSLTTSASFAAGLVQQATGHWTVPEKGIKISGMTISGVTNSLGILVHDGYYGDNGLYLELTHKDSYDLASTGLTIPSTTNYDEIVRSTGADILSNRKNGIISITTDGDLTMDGTNCNTYQNKYNKAKVTNSKARYYYNLTSICAKENKTDGEKLLLWSLNKYAATNINGNFSDAYGTNAITGTFDLEHISYYPIDVDSALSLGDATFIFYNDKIETSEQVAVASGNSDNSNRTTRGDSQHYLMHSGVFRNVSAVLSTSGNIHFKGCIGVDSTYSGALINGTLSGSLTTSSSKEIVFENLTLSNNSRYLFINKLTTNSKMSLSGVRTGGGKDFSNNDKSSSESKYGAGVTVASSLIGDVSGNGIQIVFDRMKLDSRTVENSPSDLLSVYGTTKSIFSGATFINKFDVDNNSTGVYDFKEELDWNSGTHYANVTYGMEIKTSKQFENKQQRYFQESTTAPSYVDPKDNPTARSSVYPFESGFLPYVKESTAIRNSTDYTQSVYSTREIKVNVYTVGLTVGCGTYNHPYQIEKSSQLITLATSMNKSDYFPSLRLPKINCTGTTYTNLNNTINNHWCETANTSCAEFSHSGSSYTYTEGSTTYTWSEEQVSLYLASAYYIVTKSIDIEGDYLGLGASPSSDTSGKYAFRGVIVGASSDGSVTITNKSRRYQPTSNNTNRYNTSGLITMSNGCVVKDLTIAVETPNSDKYNYRANENMPYAYDEAFPNYGAVINKIMGGDNIIDNVSVTFASNFKIREGNAYKATVGGYVGCVVNGGLIFRNVDNNSLTGFVVKLVDSNGNIKNVTVNKEYDEIIEDPETHETRTVHHTEKSITNLTDGDDLSHIYVNPFVGRVINGYAIRESADVKKTIDGVEKVIESAHYAYSEDGMTYGNGNARSGAVKVTMNNTRKNYSIPDIDTTLNYNTNSSSVLSFSKSTDNSKYDTISVPNGQALYILSIIAQSGSGCAGASSDNEEYNYNISYCGKNSKNYSGNTTDNNKATHLANYSKIGTADSTTDDDYVRSKQDTVNNRKAVPYIIYKYTSSYTSGSNTYYPARTLTQRTFYINLSAGETYCLPDSFRGIGFLGSNEIDDNMKIYGFDGKSTENSKTIIDVNSEYYLHQRADDPYFGGTIGAEYKVGIGLFNNLKQSSSTGFDRKYESDSKYQITNFTLQGYLSAHHVDGSGNDQNANPVDNRDQKSMNTAGLVPTLMISAVSHYNFANIMFSNLHINSYAYAGGFVAFTENCGVMIYINNCNADGYKVEGSGRIAGFVGSYDTTLNDNSGIHINTGLDSFGKDSFTSIMKNTIINNKLGTDVKQNYTAGILGCIYSSNTDNNKFPIDNGDNAKGHLILRNVTIEGGNAETNYIGNKSNPSGSSGGIMGGGSGRVRGCLIQNCTVRNIDIYGKFAGGIFGENANRMSGLGCSTSARIYGCTVTGDLDDNGKPQYSIMAQYYAGGVYGEIRDNGTYHAKYKSITEEDADYVEYKTDIDGVYVYGYNIISMNPSNLDAVEECTASSSKKAPTSYASGGITGNNDRDRIIQNCKVKKCVIEVGTNASSAVNTPCGGVIGRINSGIVYGYNVEVEDCDFQTHQWEDGVATNIQKAYSTDTNTPVNGMMCGNAIGNGKSNVVNIVAFESANSPASEDFNNINNSSFIVYADYLNSASGNGHGTEMSSLSVFDSGMNNVSEGGQKNYFPYVNASPVVDMGTNAILTGDGAALYDKTVGDETTKMPVIDAISSESSSYTTTTPAVKASMRIALSAGEDSNRISTYLTEMGSLPAGVEDFAIVVINTETQTDSTDLINNYIKMATNTDNDYTANSSGKYNIKIYPCTYDAGSANYVINASGKIKGLNYSSETHRYYMAGGYADSNQKDYQFSLVDVQFLNPSNNKEVAYHLYVPVLTRKMLMFGFKSASLSGTDVKDANFRNYGNTLAESLESWYTGYVHYTYRLSEIQSLLDNGTGLDWNNDKVVQLKYTSTDVNAKLSGDTQIVLVNPHSSDRYYYSTLAQLRSNPDEDSEKDTLTFAAFNSKPDGSGNAFVTATLQELMNEQGFTVSAAIGPQGQSGYVYAVTTDSSKAKVTIGSTMYEYKGEGSGDVRITVHAPSGAETSGGADSEALLVENYYINIRAAGNSVYNYSIRTPATISGGSNKPTIRVSNLKESDLTKIIMGNLYSQTFSTSVQNNGGYSTVIDSVNHRLDVSMGTTISLRGSNEDKDFILTHLSNDNIHLYHTFGVMLTAKESDGGERTKVRGEPNISVTYIFNGSEDPSEFRLNSYEGDPGYIQLRNNDIKQYLSKTNPAIIRAVAQIDFDEAWKYNLEFPSQDGSLANVGVNVSAVSNLAYNESGIMFSNMTASANTPNYYYVKESEEAELVYNMKSGILDEYDLAGDSSFNYSQQGVNPKNFIDQAQTRLPMETVATYDATKIKHNEFANATQVKCSLTLYKKTGPDGNVNYERVSDISDYFDLTKADSVFIKLNSGVTADYASGGKMTLSSDSSCHLEYTADIDQSLFERQEDQMMDAEIDFTVITGEGFNDYANYRVVLKVDLLKSDGTPVSLSTNATDWVVYTNAKVNPNMLSISEENGN